MTITTQDRILDAAEKLFGEKGFAETSLRAITAEAGANLASVNYYFRSKDSLIEAVLARRLGPLNQRRLAMLDAALAEARDSHPDVAKILRAFLAPPIELLRSRPQFGRLFGRIYTDPGGMFARVFQQHVGETRTRFLAAFRRALPGVDETEILWRMFFSMGALAQSLYAGDILKAVSNGACDPSDVEGLTERLVAFLAAGFRASVPVKEGEPQCAR